MPSHCSKRKESPITIYLVYTSLTGNTRRLAEAMAETLGVEARKVKGVSTVDGVDLLFLGSGVYGGRPARSMREFLRKLPSLEEVKVALFGTYGTSPHQLDTLAGLVQEKGGEILGRFSCKGRDWFALGLIGRGHPSPAELEAAASFAQQIRDRAEKLSDRESE